LKGRIAPTNVCAMPINWRALLHLKCSWQTDGCLM
jgi:hypothetical protein